MCYQSFITRYKPIIHEDGLVRHVDGAQVMTADDDDDRRNTVQIHTLTTNKTIAWRILTLICYTVFSFICVLYSTDWRLRGDGTSDTHTV